MAGQKGHLPWENHLSLLGLDECQSSALSVSASAQGLSENRPLHHYQTHARQRRASPVQGATVDASREQDSFPAAGCTRAQPSMGQLRADKVLYQQHLSLF